jgi:hypothetical protein
VAETGRIERALHCGVANRLWSRPQQVHLAEGGWCRPANLSVSFRFERKPGAARDRLPNGGA